MFALESKFGRDIRNHREMTVAKPAYAFIETCGDIGALFRRIKNDVGTVG